MAMAQSVVSRGRVSSGSAVKRNVTSSSPNYIRYVHKEWTENKLIVICLFKSIAKLLRILPVILKARSSYVSVYSLNLYRWNTTLASWLTRCPSVTYILYGQTTYTIESK